MAFQLKLLLAKFRPKFQSLSDKVKSAEAEGKISGVTLTNLLQFLQDLAGVETTLEAFVQQVELSLQDEVMQVEQETQTHVQANLTQETSTTSSSTTTPSITTTPYELTTSIKTIMTTMKTVTKTTTLEAFPLIVTTTRRPGRPSLAPPRLRETPPVPGCSVEMAVSQWLPSSVLSPLHANPALLSQAGWQPAADSAQGLNLKTVV